MDASLARCMLIANVLAADGIMTDEERAFLETAMDKLGLDESQRSRVRDLEGWDEAEPFIAAMDVTAKREMMDSLVHAVLADGKVSPHEMATIERLSKAFGLE